MPVVPNATVTASGAVHDRSSLAKSGGTSPTSNHFHNEMNSRGQFEPGSQYDRDACFGTSMLIVPWLGHPKETIMTARQCRSRYEPADYFRGYSLAETLSS